MDQRQSQPTEVQRGDCGRVIRPRDGTWGWCGRALHKRNLAVKPFDAPWAGGISTGCRGLLGMGHRVEAGLVFTPGIGKQEVGAAIITSSFSLSGHYQGQLHPKTVSVAANLEKLSLQM